MQRVNSIARHSYMTVQQDQGESTYGRLKRVLFNGNGRERPLGAMKKRVKKDPEHTV
jgi:hypothetical protein